MKLTDLFNEEVDTASLDGEIKRLNLSKDPDERGLSRLLIQKKDSIRREDQLRKKIQQKRDKPGIPAQNNVLQPQSQEPTISGAYPS
jgi:hypothetical protein